MRAAKYWQLPPHETFQRSLFDRQVAATRCSQMIICTNAHLFSGIRSCRSGLRYPYRTGMPRTVFSGERIKMMLQFGLVPFKVHATYQRAGSMPYIVYRYMICGPYIAKYGISVIGGYHGTHRMLTSGMAPPYGARTVWHRCLERECPGGFRVGHGPHLCGR